MNVIYARARARVRVRARACARACVCVVKRALRTRESWQVAYRGKSQVQN